MNKQTSDQGYSPGRWLSAEAMLPSPPLQTFGNVWRHFRSSQLGAGGVMPGSSGGGQGCCQASYNVQDLRQELSGPKCLQA